MGHFLRKSKIYSFFHIFLLISPSEILEAYLEFLDEGRRNSALGLDYIGFFRSATWGLRKWPSGSHDAWLVRKLIYG